jgi:Na+-transporting methylmalonyl-CoA/oxaloacetate decarboxylase gamma subunit
MTVQILTEVLLVLSILAVVLFCVVLCRVYDVLGDAKITSKILAKRSSEADELIRTFNLSISTFGKAISGFVSTFNFGKAIKEKIEEKVKENKEKEKDDKEGRE